MPSNECSNSIAELSFAVGNMAGSSTCTKDDWEQVSDILDAYQCSKRGDAGDAFEVMQVTVVKALANCDEDSGICRLTDCQELFEGHEYLGQALGLYKPEMLGIEMRGHIPPKVKGPEGIQRTGNLLQQQRAEMTRATKRTATEEKKKADAKAAREAEKKAEDERRKQTATPTPTGRRTRVTQATETEAPVTPVKRPRGRPPKPTVEPSGYERRKRWYPEKVMSMV